MRVHVFTDEGTPDWNDMFWEVNELRIGPCVLYGIGSEEAVLQARKLPR
jgi:hypothetical protein